MQRLSIFTFVICHKIRVTGTNFAVKSQTSSYGKREGQK